uniref:Uncharacterized protein n=1 Tax=Ditylenchus dipsaci TaxID=166011 RepID=A0A915DCP6_9BILA
MMRDAMRDITPAAGNVIFANGESNGGGVSQSAVGSPGILKTKEANLSPGAKNVHWSPLLVRERSVSPGSRKDEQHGKDRQKSEEKANALWNGPPLRSIRDDLGPPESSDRDIVGEEGVAIPASSSVYVFNASSSVANNDGVPNGSRMVPSVSGTQNMSLPNRSRFSISSRAGMRPLNTSFASDTSGNLNSSTAQKAENSFLGKFWNYVYN